MNKIKKILKSKSFSRFLIAVSAFICIFATGADFAIILLKIKFSTPNLGEPILGIATLILGIRQLYLLAKE